MQAVASPLSRAGVDRSQAQPFVNVIVNAYATRVGTHVSSGGASGASRDELLVMKDFRAPDGRVVELAE